jgi:hypothetical protein
LWERVRARPGRIVLYSVYEPKPEPDPPRPLVAECVRAGLAIRGASSGFTFARIGVGTS